MSTYADHMSTFRDRLQKAAQHAGVEFSQAAIAKSLGIERRQTVDRWFEDSVPRQAMIFHIAATWKVDPVWLGTGKGDMLPQPPAHLSPQEQALLHTYRRMDDKRRLSLHSILKALAKAVILLALALPAAAPRDAYAGQILHNISSQYALWVKRHIRRWIHAFYPRVRISLLSWN